ncbi:MAG: non-ribosomal peptide synthetase nps2, partial [Watsoniomyces obsoletus]
MYTSGSTGLPKGVKMSHLSVTQSLLAHDRHIPVFKRFLQFAAPTFDVAIFEVFFPFLRGATLIGCTRERMLADLPGVIVALDADAAELTPTVAGTLLRTRDAAPCLMILLTIGEMLIKSVIEEFGCSEMREGILFAMYGPTEAAIHCTIASRLPTSSSVRNIGKPLSTVTTFILRESTSTNAPEIALRGEPGELAVAGQLADGYLNRPDQNRAAFIDLPGYGQIYRTGDRAICIPDGSLEIIGRMSTGQVKLRGQRVELGEVEEVASRTSGLTMAVAVIVNDALVLF